MRIIIEGPDGSGKSTLAGELKKRLDKPIFHSGGPVVDKEEMYDRIDMQLDKTNDYIIDRCTVFSEPVYGLILRGYSLLTHKKFENYVKKMVVDGIIVVYCKAKGKIEKGKTWKSKDHMREVEEQQRYIRSLYATIMYKTSSLGLTVMNWNWKQFGNKDEEEMAYRWLEWELK